MDAGPARGNGGLHPLSGGEELCLLVKLGLPVPTETGHVGFIENLNGGVAKFYTIIATTNPKKGSRGASAFIVTLIMLSSEFGICFFVDSQRHFF